MSTIANDPRNHLSLTMDETMTNADKARGLELRYVSDIFEARNVIKPSISVLMNNTTEKTAKGELKSARALHIEVLAIANEHFAKALSEAGKKLARVHSDALRHAQAVAEHEAKKAKTAAVLTMFKRALPQARYLEVIKARDVSVDKRGKVITFTYDETFTNEKTKQPETKPFTSRSTLKTLREAADTHLKRIGELKGTATAVTTAPTPKAGTQVTNALGTMTVELRKLEGTALDNVRTSNELEAALLTAIAMRFSAKKTIFLSEIEALLRSKLKEYTIEGKVIDTTSTLIKTPKSDKTAA